jgi:hypothetical protein
MARKAVAPALLAFLMASGLHSAGRLEPPRALRVRRSKRCAASGRHSATRTPCSRGTSSPTMATRGRRTGFTVIGRLREIGYIRPGYIWIVGENLHWTTAGCSTPADVVQAWMDSAVHRIYLLKPNFEELGVAAVRGAPYDDSQTDGITVASEFGFRRAP